MIVALISIGKYIEAKAKGRNELVFFSEQLQEQLRSALELELGIRQALAWLGDEPFVVISADVWSDYHYDRLLNERLLRSRVVRSIDSRFVLRSLKETTALPL